MSAPHRRAPLAALFVTILAVSGCGGGDAPNPLEPEEPDLPDPPGSDGTLECEITGYPCTLSGVALEVLARSDAIGDSAQTMLVAGSSMAETGAWLGARDGMAEVAFDSLAVRFRLTGGRGVWVLGEGATVIEPGSAPPSAWSRAAARSASQDVVGAGSKQKRALVLSPALWDFAEWDDGPAVRAMLLETRGYQGGVVFRDNETRASTDVGPASFKGWGAYDVVHVTSHGRRLCDDQGCRGSIVATVLDAVLPAGPGTKAEKLRSITETGVEVVKSAKPGSTTEYLSVTADFFRQNYPGGLEDTVVFFNACQSFGAQATDLVDAIQGTSSVVFGWTEAVFSDDAIDAALRLYEELGEHGYPAAIAWAKLGDTRTGKATRYGPAPTLRMSARPEGGDLQIREVVTVLHPGTDQSLGTAGKVPIVGTVGDGVNDAAPWSVRVDGVVPEHAAGTMVFVSFDGVETDAVAVDGGQQGQDGQWIVSGVVFPLGYDLTDDRTVTVRARAALHSRGESDDQATATLTGTEPVMGSEWEMVATHTTGYSGNVPHSPYTATTTLTLRFADGQDPAEPNPRYVITGGTVTYSYSHSYFNCTFSAPTITFDVTPENASPSFLLFDTTKDPVTYRGIIFTGGPTIDVNENCGEGGSVREHRATNVWFNLGPGEERTVSPDRRTIAGTYTVITDVSIGDFIQEAVYTIQRVR